MENNTFKERTFLSKSLFMKGLKCLKSLYLQKNNPELADKLSPQTLERFRLSREFGKTAWGCFPGGVEIPYIHSDLIGQIQRTQNALRTAKAIYEGALSHDDVFVRTDILERMTDGWSLNEVKATTEVKEEHLYDSAIQFHVAVGTGLKIKKATIVHANRDYVRNGPLEPERLCAIKDVTEQVRDIQSVIIDELRNQKGMLLSSVSPDLDIGKQCDKPYPCDFGSYCWAHIPEISVFNLSGRGVDKFEMYRKGLIRFEDLPLEALSPDQRLHVRCTLNQKNIIHSDRVQNFLDRLSYPICYFDYETFSLPIPPYDGTRPYQDIPFQYCIFTQPSKGSELLCREFLNQPGTDPRRNFIEKFLRDIPGTGCFVVFNQTFEKRVLKYLKEWFPNYEREIDRVLGNIIDLMQPFRKRDLYFWQMQGSYSLKSIVPALFPEMSYDRLAISEGTDASRMYLYMCRCEDQAEIEKISSDLIEYCRQDTYAMFKIVEEMKKIV